MLKRLNDILSQEGVDYFSEEAIKYIIAKSEGSLRDAINILEQCINRYNKDGSVIDTNYIKDLFGDVQDEIILELVDCMEQKNIVKAIDIFKEQFYNGCNLVSLYQSLHDYFFNKLTNYFGTTEGTILERYCRITGEAVMELERSNQRIIVAEVAFIKLCKPEMEKDYNSVVQRLSELQSKIEMLESGNIIVDKSVNNVNNNNDVDKNVILYYNSNCDNINLTII
jgi:DNA polymerase-3 subunit gamma/tau